MAQVNMPNVRPPDDALTVIAKGLSIAQQVYGIKTNISHLEQHEREVREAEALSKGRYDKNQQVQLREKFDVSQNKPTAGDYQEIYDRDTDSPLYVSAFKKEISPLLDNITTMRNGKKGTAIVDKRALIKGDAKDQGILEFYEAPPEKAPGLTPYQQQMLDLRKKEAIDRGVAAFGKDESNFLDVFTNIGSVEDQLKFKLEEYDENTGTVTQTDPKTGETSTKAIKLPGTTVPGLGRVTFYDTDARVLKSTMDKIFNTELKNRSGQAVTSNELKRLREEFGEGAFNTEQEMLGALKRYKAAAIRAVKNSEARFPQEIKDEFKKRGGFSSDDIESKSPTTPKFPQDVLDYAKQHNITPEAAQRIKDLRTRGK